jgi:tetratricopeptide (TPR) repeat protein
MKYEYPDIDSRGAAKSFKRLTGDCGEFSAVFQALCRSIGIPARSVVSIWLEMSDYHGWAEILLPPYGWVPVDPTFASSFRRRIESGDPDDEASLERSMEKRGIPVKDPDWFFGNLYPTRVIVYVGANVEVKSERTGIERTFRFMQPGGTMALPPAVELKGLSPKTVHGGFIVFGDERDDIERAWARTEKELAASYKSAGLHEEAERGFLLKTEENPKDALSWLNLGDLYMDSDRYDDAIDAFQKCLEGEAPDVKPILDLIARVHRGNCYDLKGERESALAEYKLAEASGIDFAGMQDSVRACLKEPYKKKD